MKTFPAAISLSVALWACVGCGNSTSVELTEVRGRVLLDGKPGANLLVAFIPQHPGAAKKDSLAGSTSVARTDDDGNYDLRYIGGERKGAVPGKHVVYVARPCVDGRPDEPILNQLPPCYNTQSNITRDVPKGTVFVADIELRTRM